MTEDVSNEDDSAEDGPMLFSNVAFAWLTSAAWSYWTTLWLVTSLAHAIKWNVQDPILLEDTELGDHCYK